MTLCILINLMTITFRWLGESRKSIHPFAFLQFSHGPRMCIGKRFAELEIQLWICEILRNFRVEWHGDKDVIEPEFKLMNVPDGELKFKFIDL